MKTLEEKRQYAREYAKQYYEKHRNDNRKDYRPQYQKIIERMPVNTRLFKQGQLVNLGGGRTGIVIRDYDKFVRVKITSGEQYYSECFYREEIR